MVWISLRGSRVSRGLAPAGRLAGGAALALAPCLAHNLAAAGDPVLVTASAGANLVLGNHAGATGRYHPPPGLPPQLVWITDNAYRLRP